MFELSQKVKTNIPIVIFCILLLFVIKPSFCFKPNDQPREYGVGLDSSGYKKTFFSMNIMIIFIVLLVYFLNK